MLMISFYRCDSSIAGIFIFSHRQMLGNCRKIYIICSTTNSNCVVAAQYIKATLWEPPMIYYPILLPCFLNFAFDISPALVVAVASAEAPPLAVAAMRTKTQLVHTHTHIPTPRPCATPRQRERACTVSWRVVTQRNKIKHAPKHIHPSRNIAYLVGNNSWVHPLPPLARLDKTTTTWRKNNGNNNEGNASSIFEATCLTSATCVSCRQRRIRRREAWHSWMPQGESFGRPANSNWS